MNTSFQKLPLSEWLETKTALHLFFQIVGKIRMQLHPKKNHWWHVTLYLTARGLTTGPIPYQKGIFQIDFDFIKHELQIKTSQGEASSFALENLSVAEFYKLIFSKLDTLNIPIKIYDKPFDPTKTGSDIPFSKDTQHIYSDKKAVEKFWHILLWTYPIFQNFCGKFNYKTTPVHLFWHSMDYAITFFSGNPAPKIEGMDPVSAEAYSHEVISFGFWAGDTSLPEPAFYSYTYPAPEGLPQQKLLPSEAAWHEVNNNAMAILKYHDLIKHSDPDKQLLNFLQSAFDAGSTLAKWKTQEPNHN